MKGKVSHLPNEQITNYVDNFSSPELPVQFQTPPMFTGSFERPSRLVFTASTETRRSGAHVLRGYESYAIYRKGINLQGFIAETDQFSTADESTA